MASYERTFYGGYNSRRFYPGMYGKGDDGVCTFNSFSLSSMSLQMFVLITLTPGEECDSNATGSVRPSVWTCTSKNIAPIDLIFVRKK